MGPSGINRRNVGRIAERVVANELEFRGFRVSDLNKEGTAANADLLAAGNGRTWQVQVKGCTAEDGWWFGYGHCTEEIIAGNGRTWQVQVKGCTAEDGWWFGYGHCTEEIIAGNELMFNRCSSFYNAQIVALVCIKSPNEYSCLVLPADTAEQAAQMNVTREYRSKKRDGSAKKPGPVWIAPEYPPRRADSSRLDSWKVEQGVIVPYRDNWNALNEVG